MFVSENDGCLPIVLATSLHIKPSLQLPMLNVRTSYTKIQTCLQPASNDVPHPSDDGDRLVSTNRMACAATRSAAHNPEDQGHASAHRHQRYNSPVHRRPCHAPLQPQAQGRVSPRQARRDPASLSARRPSRRQSSTHQLTSRSPRPLDRPARSITFKITYIPGPLPRPSPSTHLLTHTSTPNTRPRLAPLRPETRRHARRRCSRLAA